LRFGAIVRRATAWRDGWRPWVAIVGIVIAWMAASPVVWDAHEMSWAMSAPPPLALCAVGCKTSCMLVHRPQRRRVGVAVPPPLRAARSAPPFGVDDVAQLEGGPELGTAITARRIAILSRAN